jgi:hypothetical protein
MAEFNVTLGTTPFLAKEFTTLTYTPILQPVSHIQFLYQFSL